MPETPSSVSEIRTRLETVATLLRQSKSLDAEAQRTLADLVDELTRSLETENLPAAELAHLAEITDHLAYTLHNQQDLGIVAKARASLQRAVGNAEAGAPVAVGLARKVLDALANIGI